MYSYQARNPFAYRKPMTKKIPVKVTEVSADDVWAAAALADRINGGRYYKEVVQNEDNTIKHNTNRLIIIKVLENTSEHVVTDEDRELGLAARKWHQGNLLMTAIKRPLTGFETNLQKAAVMDTFALEVHRLEIATIASQIRTYRFGLLAEQKTFGSDTSPLAPIGSTVTCQVEVFKSVYSQRYNTVYIMAITIKERKVVRFTAKEQYDVGTVLTIKGRVKAHLDEGTCLNYVRIG